MPDHVRAWIKERVRDRGSVPMPDRIFNQALGYHECAMRCLELREGHGFLFQPSLVLFAFVIELYLKGLRASEQKETRWGGHSLHRIYNSLEERTKAKISQRYRERYDQELAADLSSYSKIFEELRYSYELEGSHETDMSGVAQLASALYEVWIDLRPDLLRPGITHDRIVDARQGTPIVNYNTHHVKSLESKSLKGEALHWATRRLLVLLLVSFFERLGVPRSAMSFHLNRSREFISLWEKEGKPT